MRFFCATVVAVLVAVANSQTTFFVNQYAADHETESECQFGEPETVLTMYAVKANVCHRVSNLATATDKYVKITTGANQSEALVFDDFCDSGCVSCTTQTDEVELKDCFETSQGSAAIHLEYCAGSTNLVVRNGLSVFMHDGSSCGPESISDGKVLLVRNYEKVGTDGCEFDWQLGNRKNYFTLNISEVNGTTYFEGAFGCTEETCNPRNCTHVIERPLMEDQCGQHNGKAIRLQDTPTALSPCKGAGPRPTNSPGGSTETPGGFGDGANDPALIGSVVGGGVAVALAIFGVALAYRRYEFRQRQALNVHYTSVKNTNYGSANYDDEGMTTDI